MLGRLLTNDPSFFAYLSLDIYAQKTYLGIFFSKNHFFEVSTKICRRDQIYLTLKAFLIRSILLDLKSPSCNSFKWGVNWPQAISVFNRSGRYFPVIYPSFACPSDKNPQHFCWNGCIPHLRLNHFNQILLYYHAKYIPSYQIKESRHTVCSWVNRSL